MIRRHKRKSLYYGWYIAIVFAITETVSFGVIYYAFTVFITPMEADLGWSRGELSGAFSLFLLMTGLMAFPVGWWLDKRGSRLLMTLGSTGATLLVLMWSQVNSLPEFMLIMTLMGCCGAAILYEPAFAVIAAWFTHKRGAAMAIVTFTAGFASTIFIPLSDALLVAFGWRQAVFMLGVLLGIITIPLHLLILRGKPADLGLLPDGKTSLLETKPTSSVSLGMALRSRFFWLMTLAFALSTLSISALRVHFIPLLISLGIQSSAAALASGSIGIMQVIGRMIFAPIEARFSARTMTIGVFALLTLSLTMLLFGPSPAWIILFIALFGMAVGTHTLTRPLMVADAYGASFYGRISSVMVIALTMARTSAPFAAGLIFDLFHSYGPVLVGAVGFSALSLGLILFLPKKH